MAEVIGHLRNDATKGEQLTLKLLKDNLPKEYSVYVETPIHTKRDIRYPDFIILTNYGFIVLEIKDWINIEKADPSGVTIRTRSNEIHRHPNPVTGARDFAIKLSNELNARQKQNRDSRGKIPWSYAAVLINLPISTITQLQLPWGKDFVWGKHDLSISDLLQKRMRNIFPPDRMRPLTKRELDSVRAIIYPIVEINLHGRLPVILDTEQEKIVAESPKVSTEPTPVQISRGERKKMQSNLFEEFTETVHPEEYPDISKKLSENTSIRLVRGIAGSGKTLVLAQRAKFLSAQYPEWNIAVISFNDGLVSNLEAELRGSNNVKVMTFHKFCTNLLRSTLTKFNATDPDGWVVRHHKNYVGLDNLSVSFLTDEIKWIKDTGITSLDEYLQVERRGRGAQARLTKSLREQVYKLLEGYNEYLQVQKLTDWADVPYLVHEKLENGECQFAPFDAILIDEAQDFAPSWIKTLLSTLTPEGGTIFLADDPTQSIYRYFSWKEKGIPVVGRTKWLNVPYRNTFEIYNLAYEVIRDDAILKKSFSEEGWELENPLDPATMRHGPKPLIVKTKLPQHEMSFLRSNINRLLQKGVSPQNIAVLHRRTRGVKWLEDALRGLDVRIGSFHALKGLEFEAVFLSRLNDTFQNLSDENEISEERRLLYMVITRARQQLTMTYMGILPGEFRALTPFMDMIEY